MIFHAWYFEKTWFFRKNEKSWFLKYHEMFEISYFFLPRPTYIIYVRKFLYCAKREPGTAQMGLRPAHDFSGMIFQGADTRKFAVISFSNIMDDFPNIMIFRAWRWHTICPKNFNELYIRWYVTLNLTSFIHFFFPPHRKKKRRKAMDRLKRLDSLSKCHACVTPFHDDDNYRLPSKGKTCEHRLCKSCIYTYHIHEYDPFKRRSRRHFQLNCPICHSQKSFHAKRPIIDLDLVRSLKKTKGFRKEIVLVHQQPWKIPVGAYAHLFERIGTCIETEEAVPFREELIRDVLLGLIQVHT